MIFLGVTHYNQRQIYILNEHNHVQILTLGTQLRLLPKYIYISIIESHIAWLITFCDERD